jgi:Tfp pilus assembly PilM family ATPase
MKTAKKKTENSVFKKQKNIIILPKKSTMGIDIGSKNIKMAVVKGDKILSAVSEPIANGVVVDGVIEAPDILIKSLKNARRHLKGSCSHGTLCLSGKDLIMREITLPQMKEDQVLANIKNELSNIYLLASGDYTIDYRILETVDNEITGEKSMRVLVVSAPKALISDYIKVCKKAGIKLDRIDVLPNAHTKLIRKIINDQERSETIEVKLEKVNNNDKLTSGQKKKAVKAVKKDNKAAQKQAKKDRKREDLINKEKKAAKEREDAALKQKAKEEAEERARKAEETKRKLEKEKARAKAKLTAEKAAKEAMEKRHKTEEKETEESKKSEVKEISWYFGRKLDLDQGLYEENKKEEAPKEGKEETSLEKEPFDRYFNSNPFNEYSGVTDGFDVDTKHEEKDPVDDYLNIKIKDPVPYEDFTVSLDNNIFNEYVAGNKEIGIGLFADPIKESGHPVIDIPEVSGDDQAENISGEPLKTLHDYISDDEASNILDNLLNDTLKAKEIKAEPEKEKNILENVCLIDIGFTMSNVTFIRNGSYSMHKNIRYGGEYINEAISEKMSLDMNSAESYKLSQNNNKTGSLYEYYDSIISELDNTMYYYKTNNNQNGVDCIVIAGGSSRLGGIKEYFSQQLGVPVFMLSEIAAYKIAPKLIKRQKGKDIHFEDYLGAVSITIKEEWV